MLVLAQVPTWTDLTGIALVTASVTLHRDPPTTDTTHRGGRRAAEPVPAAETT